MDNSIDPLCFLYPYYCITLQRSLYIIQLKSISPPPHTTLFLFTHNPYTLFPLTAIQIRVFVSCLN